MTATTTSPRPAMLSLGIPARAVVAWRALTVALVELETPTACFESDLWWPSGTESTEVAQSLCWRCPVQPECAAYAVAADERFGVWGALTPADRAAGAR